MKNIPATHLLMAFDAVIRHRSFTKAAEELNVSYSTVSHRIRTLERELGAPLFERTTRSIALTPQGQYLSERLKEPMRALEQAFAAFDKRSNVVRISVLPSFARFRLIPELNSLNEAYPRLSIEIDATTRLADVDGGEADIAIRFTPHRPKAHFCEKLLDDEWFPVASGAYLEKLKSSSLEEVFNRATLLTHRRQPWTPWFERACLIQPKNARHLIFTDTGNMLEAAMNRHGIALGRKSLAQPLLTNGDLVKVSEDAIPSDYSYYLIASDRGVRSREVTLVLHWLKRLVHDG